MVWCVETPQRLIMSAGHLRWGLYLFLNHYIMCQLNQSQIEPYSRQLTVSYLHQLDSAVPFIRLCGKWLKEAGFSVDDKVNVIVKNNLLVIEPVK